MNLRRLERYPGLKVDKNKIIRSLSGASFEPHKWNGRLIRNMIDTAVALAHEDAKRSDTQVVKLTSEHLHAVLKSSQEFSTYLSEVHGADEAERARSAGTRIDDFPPDRRRL